MSGGFACTCRPRDRSRWRITMYKCNYSAFSGYKYTASAYSAIQCLECGSRWRTRAAYVDELRLAEETR